MNQEDQKPPLGDSGMTEVPDDELGRVVGGDGYGEGVWKSTCAYCGWYAGPGDWNSVATAHILHDNLAGHDPKLQRVG